MGVKDYLKAEEKAVRAGLDISVIYAHVDTLVHPWNFYDVLNVLSEKILYLHFEDNLQYSKMTFRCKCFLALGKIFCKGLYIL